MPAAAQIVSRTTMDTNIDRCAAGPRGLEG